MRKGDPGHEHVMSRGDGWVLRNRGMSRRRPGLYATQKEAIAAAINTTQSTSIYVHRRDGTVERVIFLPRGAGRPTAELFFEAGEPEVAS